MRPKPIKFFSRAAAMLLMMLLTATTAWADTETVSYIDAAGQTLPVSATVLPVSESTLGSKGATTCTS